MARRFEVVRGVESLDATGVQLAVARPGMLGHMSTEAKRAAKAITRELSHLATR